MSIDQVIVNRQNQLRAALALNKKRYSESGNIYANEDGIQYFPVVNATLYQAARDSKYSEINASTLKNISEFHGSVKLSNDFIQNLQNGNLAESIVLLSKQRNDAVKHIQAQIHEAESKLHEQLESANRILSIMKDISEAFYKNTKDNTSLHKYDSELHELCMLGAEAMPDAYEPSNIRLAGQHVPLYSKLKLKDGEFYIDDGTNTKLDSDKVSGAIGAYHRAVHEWKAYEEWVNQFYQSIIDIISAKLASRASQKPITGSKVHNADDKLQLDVADYILNEGRFTVDYSDCHTVGDFVAKTNETIGKQTVSFGDISTVGFTKQVKLIENCSITNNGTAFCVEFNSCLPDTELRVLSIATAKNVIKPNASGTKKFMFDVGAIEDGLFNIVMCAITPDGESRTVRLKCNMENNQLKFIKCDDYIIFEGCKCHINDNGNVVIIPPNDCAVSVCNDDINLLFGFLTITSLSNGITLENYKPDMQVSFFGEENLTIRHTEKSLTFQSVSGGDYIEIDGIKYNINSLDISSSLVNIANACNVRLHGTIKCAANGNILTVASLNKDIVNITICRGGNKELHELNTTDTIKVPCICYDNANNMLKNIAVALTDPNGSLSTIVNNQTSDIVNQCTKADSEYDINSQAHERAVKEVVDSNQQRNGLTAQQLQGTVDTLAELLRILQDYREQMFRILSY